MVVFPWGLWCGFAVGITVVVMFQTQRDLAGVFFFFFLMPEVEGERQKGKE